MLFSFFKKGFSLIEVIVVIGILGFLATTSVSAYKVFGNSGKVFSAREDVLSAMRRARQASIARAEDDFWSVKIEGGKATVFKGGDWLGREESFDEVFALPSGISVSGITEVSFSSPIGEPNSTGEVFLNYGENQKKVSLNDKGVLGE